MRGCGTELNLARLRVRVEDAKRQKGFLKSIFFIDFKAAYDMVLHEILFEKLITKELPIKVVNTIKLIYSHSKVRVVALTDPININGGVLQGSVISPMLFNVFIDDLIRKLGVECFEVLAYADDIAVISIGEAQLERAFDILDEWARANSMVVNKLKSGIIRIGKKPNKNGESIRGYPVVEKYRYLGVWINMDVNCQAQIDNISKKVEVYLKRHKKLLFKYFSVRSLLKIHQYFHRSRLLYGMCAFVDLGKAMERLDSKVMKMAKGIFRLPMQTSHARIRATLGLVSTKGKLVCRLLKVLNKYVRVFGERATKWDRDVLEFAESLKVGDDNMVNVEELTKEIERNCLKKDIEGYLKVEIWKDEYADILKKEVYGQYDGRSVFLLKYFCNAAYYKERYQETCVFCKEVVCSRQHIVDDCKEFEMEGCCLVEFLMRCGLYKAGKLSDALDQIYFAPPEDRKVRKQAFEEIIGYMAEIHKRNRGDFEEQLLLD